MREAADETERDASEVVELQEFVQVHCKRLECDAQVIAEHKVVLGMGVNSRVGGSGRLASVLAREERGLTGIHTSFC